MPNTNNSTTNSFASMVNSLISANQQELNTFMPAKILEYYPNKQTADVQLVLQRTLIDPPSTINRPVLYDAPVMFPRSKTQCIHIPLEKGDNVGVIFCQRSLEDWKQVGDITKVNDIRLHDVSDGVVIAGLDIESNAKTLPSPSKLSISSTSGMWIGNPQGTPAVLAGVSEAELFQALAELCTIISTLAPMDSLNKPCTPDQVALPKLTELSALFKSIAGN